MISHHTGRLGFCYFICPKKSPQREVFHIVAGDSFHAGVGNGVIVLEAHAAEAFFVDAWLDGDHFAAQQGFGASHHDKRVFRVHQAHAVAGVAGHKA